MLSLLYPPLKMRSQNKGPQMPSGDPRSWARLGGVPPPESEAACSIRKHAALSCLMDALVPALAPASGTPVLGLRLSYLPAAPPASGREPAPQAPPLRTEDRPSACQSWKEGYGSPAFLRTPVPIPAPSDKAGLKGRGVLPATSKAPGSRLPHRSPPAPTSYRV